MKKKSTKSRIDSIIFKDLMKIKQEHRNMLGKFIIEQGYKIAKGKEDKTFTDCIDLLNEIKTQINKLQQTYERD